MLKTLKKRFGAWLGPWLRSGPLWWKLPLLILAPWPLVLLVEWALGRLVDDGHTDWWEVFAYPATIVGIVLTHLVLVWLGSYDWQRRDRA